MAYRKERTYMVFSREFISSAIKKAASETTQNLAFAPIPKPGAYVGKIMYASEKNKDGSTYENRFGKPAIQIYVEIDDGSEYDGCIMKKYNEIKANPQRETKYPNYGIFDRIELPDRYGNFETRKAENFINMFLKNLADSNPGLDISDTSAWKGARIGLVFKRYSYLNAEGETKSAIELWFLCATDEDSIKRADERAKAASFIPPEKEEKKATRPVQQNVWGQSQQVQPQPQVQPVQNVWGQQEQQPSVQPQSQAPIQNNYWGQQQQAPQPVQQQVQNQNIWGQQDSQDEGFKPAPAEIHSMWDAQNQQIEYQNQNNVPVEYVEDDEEPDWDEELPYL